MTVEELLSGCTTLVHSVVADGPFAASAQLLSDAGDLSIRVEIGPAFPFRLPRVFLLEEGVPASPPQMPDGSICWQDASGLVNHSNPSAVMAHTLARVRDLLDHSLHERDWPERMAEYGTYWGQRAKEHCLVRAPSVSTPTPLVPGIAENLLVPGRWNDAVGVLVPLEQGSLPYPEAVITVDWVRDATMPLLAAPTRRKLSSLLGQRFVGLIVLQLPRDNGLPLLLGLRFKKGRSKKHPLLWKSRAARVRPVRAHNFDPDHLRRRGGASMGLKNKAVVVVGCGSVGGQVALDLVRSGVGNLVLVDPDILTPENTFRHVLGVGIPFLNKAHQLAMHLRVSFPGTSAVGYPVPIEDALPGIDLERVDAIVVAVDRPAVAQAVNQATAAAGVATVVHGWLEAYGIGSHVLRVHSGEKGCFECLVRDRAGGLIDNRAHLAAPGQDFTKDQAGCGGRYVEFGAVHASRTALLAVEETLRGLRGDRRGGLTTWRGDLEPLLAAGFEMSKRALDWPELQPLAHIASDELAVSACPVCG